jgi:iron complex outermembrane receptor protein
MWIVGTALLAVGMAVVPDIVRAAEADKPATDAVFDFFLKEAEVVTASRRAQKKSDSPVAIDVITRDEIEHSGAHDLWELLRFRVGLDVAASMSIEGNPAEVNVRGLPNEFSQSLQVLVDGRSIVSPSNSGIYWGYLPVGLDDIERVEIVRGPNSALFGANAGQGVINIITRKPGANAGEYHVEAGQFGYVNSHLGMDIDGGRVKARFSLSDRKNGSLPTPQGDSSQDLSSSQDHRFNGRLSLQVWEDGELELFAGDTEKDGNFPIGPSQGYMSGQYLMGQMHQKIGDQSLDLTLSDRNDRIVAGTSDLIEAVWDADALFRLSLLDGKSLSTFGGSLRDSQATSDLKFNFGNSGPDSHQQNIMRRAYAAETLSPLDWATIVLAASFESSDLGGQWPAYQGALILKPAEGHSLRLSGSKSPTMPSMFNKNLALFNNYGSVGPLPGPSGFMVYPLGLVALGNDAAIPTQVSSYEATWSSSFLERHLTTEVTGFQMEIDGMPNYDPTAPPISTPFGDFAPIGNGKFAYVNVAGIPYLTEFNDTSFVLRGTETVLTYKLRGGSTVQVNHTYEDVYYSSPRHPQNKMLDYATPWNKVNILAQSDLIWGFNAATQIAWVGQHMGVTNSLGKAGFIPDQAKVDLRLGYKPRKDLEIYVTALNVDHAFRTEAFDGTAQPQSYYGGLNLRWGN